MTVIHVHSIIVQPTKPQNIFKQLLQKFHLYYFKCIVKQHIILNFGTVRYFKLCTISINYPQKKKREKIVYIFCIKYVSYITHYKTHIMSNIFKVLMSCMCFIVLHKSLLWQYAVQMYLFIDVDSSHFLIHQKMTSVRHFLKASLRLIAK